jgi:hypothetical protein
MAPRHAHRYKNLPGRGRFEARWVPSGDGNAAWIVWDLLGEQPEAHKQALARRGLEPMPDPGVPVVGYPVLPLVYHEDEDKAWAKANELNRADALIEGIDP